MIEKQFLSDNLIIDYLNIYYGIKVEALNILPLGADINASVYKAHSANDLNYFVKIKHNDQNNLGVIIQQLLHDHGVKEIISPIKTKRNENLLYINNLSLLVYPFIEGHNGFVQHLTANQWIILGKTLRQIHDFNLPLFVKNRVNQESYSPKWREAIRSIYNHIDAKPEITDKISLELLKFMKEYAETILYLVNCAEKLALKIQKQSPEFVLCHSDIHGGNVLLSNEGAVYIIDWDQPIMAAKERDLMFIGGGVGNTWNDPKEEELFYKGYGKTEINWEILAYYRYERIIEDIAVYSHQVFFTHEQNREILFKHFMDMFEQNGVVDIALRTGNNLPKNFN